ncbi:hypothetical protein LCGC14_2083790, partial [marine sediment metagenome]
MPKEKAVSISNFTDKDFSSVAEMIIQEHKDRKKRRETLEKHWDEVDRQLAMKPELSHKSNTAGKVIPGREWMPETELPLQAQTLEMLSADVRRLLFPKNRDSFSARAALTEKYFTRFNKAGSPFAGELPAKDESIHAHLDQDNADRLAAAMITHWRSQYDYRGHMDMINAQAISRGFGVGRLRKVRRRILGYDARPGGSINQKIPVLVPRDVRKVYLDDNATSVMHEGETIGPNIIQEQPIRYADLMASAEDGGTDPRDENGGYIPSQIKKLSGGSNDVVQLLELEGDLVVDSTNSTLITRDVVVTVAVGSKKVANNFGLVRYRQGQEFSTYLVHQYHLEGPEFTSGASPLLKGMPIAKLAAQTMNRIMESAQLKNSPPVGWNKDEIAFAATGGPVIAPYAQWSTADLEAIKVWADIGGDPSGLLAVFSGLLSLYADMTGVTPPRLGAQTKSHTTAFAKDVELNQGAVRTVDYVNSILEGPMTRSLALEYRMGLSTMRGRQTIFIPNWNEFVHVTKAHLPDIVKFIAIGAGAPAEDQARNQQRLQSAQTALELDRMAQEAG